ncbi:hypothetical protein WG936_04775 [Corynebacterium sp. H127]|uniref:hypothetical protein n=1 Tax=Corynebacterium sp. H127 TaxID=3133418 RepID=UPI0030A0435E
MWFILAALLLIAIAVFLLWFSRRQQQQSAQDASEVDSTPAELGGGGTQGTEVLANAGPAIGWDELSEPLTPGVARKIEVVEDLEPDLGEEPEPEPIAEPEPEPDSIAEVIADIEVAEPAAPSEPVAKHAEDAVTESDPREHREHRLGLKLPGGARRERKHWASDRGFDYAKADDYLTDEWSRGAAATGAAPREVVSGVVESFGLEYEMYLVDLENVPVMAIRRTAASDVVLDARRVGELLDDDSDDLLPVTQVSGFAILSNDFGAAERAIDERIIAALAAMPAAVTAVWAESDWVLAQTQKSSTSEDWDRMIEPLALIADASRILPPRAVRNLEVPVKTRPVGDPVLVEKQQEPELLRVPRSEDPVEMPSRAQRAAHGVVEARPVGVDEVGAIAEGPAELPESDGTRVVRRDTKPTIF